MSVLLSISLLNRKIDFYRKLMGSEQFQQWQKEKNPKAQKTVNRFSYWRCEKTLITQYEWKPLRFGCEPAHKEEVELRNEHGSWFKKWDHDEPWGFTKEWRVAKPLTKNIFKKG